MEDQFNLNLKALMDFRVPTRKKILFHWLITLFLPFKDMTQSSMVSALLNPVQLNRIEKNRTESFNAQRNSAAESASYFWVASPGSLLGSLVHLRGFSSPWTQSWIPKHYFHFLLLVKSSSSQVNYAQVKPAVLTEFRIGTNKSLQHL